MPEQTTEHCIEEAEKLLDSLLVPYAFLNNFLKVSIIRGVQLHQFQRNGVAYQP